MIIILSMIGVISCGDSNSKNNNDTQKQVSNENDRPMGPRRGYGPMFDPKTVVVVYGKVSSVENIPRRSRGNRMGMHHGVHLILKTKSGSVNVHLGPSWYLDKKGFTFNKNDKLRVKGSRIKYDDNTSIIASDVWKGKRHLKLRNKDGIPMWAGSGRGRMGR